MRSATSDEPVSKRRKVEAIDVQAEYDFRSGIRGKYTGRVRAGGRVVVLEPDVARIFPDSQAVNRALRALAEIVRRTTRDAR